MSWCEAINRRALSWPAVREYLSNEFPDVLTQFTSVEPKRKMRPRDLLYARRAGGFAFDFWCEGGDLNDISRLLEKFDDLLERSNSHRRDVGDVVNVLAQIKGDITDQVDGMLAESVTGGIWSLSAEQRSQLLDEWQQKIPLSSVLDRTAEIHRRHQSAIARLRQCVHEVDSKALAGGQYSLEYQVLFYSIC